MKAIILLVLVFAFSQWGFAQSISIDYLNKKQEIVMIGGDMERSQSFLQKASNPQQISDWLYKDIPFKACRVSYDKKQELTQGVKNLDFYNDAIKSMKMLQLSNPAIKFYATMKSDYNGYDNENNLPNWICDYKPTTFFKVPEYATFLADYLELMHTNGVTISYMAVAKEWQTVVTVDRTIAIIEALTPILNTRNVPVPLFTDPATWSVTQGVSFVNGIVAKNKQSLFHAFSTHDYDDSQSSYPDFVTACKTAGKYAWNDETSNGGPGRTNGVEPADIASLLTAYSNKAFMYQKGIQGEVIFEQFSRGVSSETRSIYFTEGQPGKRMRAYYVMQLYASNVLNRNYVPVTKTSLPDLSTMAFVNNDEIVIWLINNGTSDYNSIPVNLNNVNILGSATQIAFDAKLPITGKGDILTAQAANKYVVSLKAKSINCLKFALNAAASTDNFTISTSAIDFGYVALSTPQVEYDMIINATNLGSNINLSISGPSAAAYEIVGSSVIPASALVWNHIVKIRFKPTMDGSFQATLNAASNSVSQTVSLTGDAYTSQIVDMPFAETFPNLIVNSGPISNATVNGFTLYKGWEIKNGLSSTTDRINISSSETNQGYLITPEINLAGAFELKFFARMLANDVGADNAAKIANNAYRNILATIGGDTIYDHKKNGGTLYQNYNEWTTTFVYTGTDRIKFSPKVSNQGDWAGVSDGLSIGPKGVSIRVQSTSLPAVNIAYGQKLHLGDVERGKTAVFSFPLKGFNLSQPLNFTLPTNTAMQMTKVQFSPDVDKKVNEAVEISVNAQLLTPGVYTEKLLLVGENANIRTRTIWISYEVISATTGIDNKNSFDGVVYSKPNQIVVKVNKPSMISIYSLTGSLVNQFYVSQNHTFEVPNGLYIVKAGATTTKVLVH